MDLFFIQLGTMSFQASVVIVVMLILRKLFAMMGVSKKYIMLLWMVPFLFLICPWKISSPVGVWEHAPSDEIYMHSVIEQIEKETAFSEYQEVVQEQGIINESNDTTDKDGQENKLEIVWNSIGAVWAAGMVMFLFYAAVSYLRLMKKLQCCICETENIYFVDNLAVPITAGFIKPKIYLPSGMPEEHIYYVVEHERTHIRRKDQITKLIAYVISCVHWFNPMVWLAYHFLEKDMEMACDEETLQRIGMEQKKEYATALMQLSAGTRNVFAVPLAFGEGDTKGRIKNVMHYKRTVKRAAVLAVGFGVLVLAVFVTKQENRSYIQEGTEDTHNVEQGMQTESTEESIGSELTFDMVREAAAVHTFHELDFHSYSNGEEWYFEDSNALNYYINFYYDYDDEVYKLRASHSIKNDELTAIYITRESDGEMRWLYRDEDGVNEYSDYLEPLLVTKENVDNWLSIELPEEYSLGTYQANAGIAGGALILPQAYELYGDEVFAPQEWYYAGFVGQIPNAKETFIFENGELIDGAVNWWNHSSCEKLEVLDLDWQALLVHYNHDLYTAAGVGWLEEDDIDTSLIDTTSDYWYFFFTKEGEEKAYYLSLSEKLFTKEEAVAIAETVDIKE